MTYCPFCRHTRGHVAGCKLDGAKSYELVDIIYEQANLLKEWVRVAEWGESPSNISTDTRRFFGWPMPTGGLKEACQALDEAAEEKGGGLTVDDALQAVGGVLGIPLPVRERKDVNCGDGSTEDDDL